MKRAISPIALLVLAGVAGAQTFGGSIIDRPNVDFAHQITFIDTGHLAPTNGKIVQWHLFAKGTGDVTFQIWRPVNPGYQLIGANTVSIGSLGAQTIDVAEPDQISVQAGDLLGFRYNQTIYGARVIAFDFNAGDYVWTNWPDQSTDVPIGGVLQNLVGAGEHRGYSFAATVAVPEPGTIAALGLGALLLIRRRR
ncbi:MAG: PEP-CTERM sorting domain-containing protein [Fimbriimonadales bacterium]